MILSVHIADVGPRAALGILRAAPAPGDVPGLRYAEPAIGAALGGAVLQAPRPGRVGLIAAWDRDESLEDFLHGHELAKRLAGGWHVRLDPLRIWGAWSALPDFPREQQPVDPDEPVAVLTLGRLRFRRAPSFFRTNAPAADQAVAHPALAAGTGLARPPRFLATFSLWRSAAEMRAYATGPEVTGHADAVRAHRARAFHHESAFMRFRPYAARGTWDGREPLAAIRREPSASPSTPGPPSPTPARGR